MDFFEINNAMLNFLTTTLSIFFWFVIILIPLVVIHEFGHLLISRMFGVKIPEYAIGMPLVKRTFYKRWRGVIWSFYWPLLGGFVRIYGDNDAIDEAYETGKTDPKKAKTDFVPNRIQEIINNRELQFFLEDNGLEYTKDWQNFEAMARKSQKLEMTSELFVNFAFGLLVGFNLTDNKTESISFDEKKLRVNEFFDRMWKQLGTLVEWEYDKQINSKETFFSKNWIQQTLIISGGVLFNMIAAVLLFWLLFSGVGINNTMYPVDQFSTLTKNATITSQSEYITSSVVADSVAAKAGLKSGDKIYKFAGVLTSTITSQQQFIDLVQANKDKTVEIEYKSKDSDELQTTKATLVKNDKGEYKFGIGSVLREINFEAKNFGSGFNLALNQTGLVVNQTFTVLGDIFKALLPNQDKTVLQYVGGPVAVGSISSKIFDTQGVQGIITIMAAISINLAVLNMLPIPALDGGRWIILTINKLTKKRNLKIEAAVISITFLLMMGLAIFIAFNDVRGVIGGRF